MEMQVEIGHESPSPKCVTVGYVAPPTNVTGEPMKGSTHFDLTVDSKPLFLCINDVHKRPMIYGYARVSTDGQSVNAQVKQLREAGAEKVFRETASGARSDRAGLRRALAALDKGDVLMVTRLDRLARLNRDFVNTVEDIAAKKAGFKSLGDTWADMAARLSGDGRAGAPVGPSHISRYRRVMPLACHP